MAWRFFTPTAASDTGSDIPVGTINAYAASAAPTGWLMCDGATASTATYPDLYALISTTYGATGSGYFTLPDFRGRVAVGKGTAGAIDALGDNEGVATVGNRRPQHRHTAHSHTWTGYTGTGTVGQIGDQRQTAATTVPTSSVDGGSGNANDSLDAPAFLVINYIIKT